MRKLVKIILVASAIMVILIVFQYRSFISYGLHLAKGQWHILYNAVPVETALSGDTYTRDQKEKIREIQRICAFARDSLGLVTGDNYTCIYNQQDKAVLWAVTACPRFSLKPYNWHYPILGDMAYKGFFNKAMAEDEVALCKKRGLDASAGEVRAWSTLGWFDDPVLSTMLTLDKGRLAELILHELTHRNIFYNDSSSANENIASYIGVEGARQYLISNGDSVEEKQYQAYLCNRTRYLSFMEHAAKELDSLYHHFPAGSDLAEKRQLKARYLKQITNRFSALQFGNDTIFQLGEHPDNSFFSDFLLYHGRDQELHQLCLEEGGLRKMIVVLKSDH